jgi:4'-phosphopantetheinyl transferase EntD
LARLGVRDFPLLVGADRGPVWPAGVIGSLSHCGDFCGVAVARRGFVVGVGLDVERVRALSDRVASIVCTAGELARLNGMPPSSSVPWTMVVFSAKESVYKCFRPLAQSWLDFHDVEIDFAPETGTFSARILRTRGTDGVSAAPMIASLRGRFACDESHVFAGVTLTAPELQGAD